MDTSFLQCQLFSPIYLFCRYLHGFSEKIRKCLRQLYFSYQQYLL